MSFMDRLRANFHEANHHVSKNAELQKLQAFAERQGWRVIRTPEREGSPDLVMFHADYGPMVFTIEFRNPPDARRVDWSDYVNFCGVPAFFISHDTDWDVESLIMDGPPKLENLA